MGSITGQKIEYNGVGALRSQRHIPSKHVPPPPGSRARAPLSWLNLDSFPPRPVIMITSGIINTKFDRRLQPLTADLSIITFCMQKPIVLVRVRSGAKSIRLLHPKRTRASISLFAVIREVKTTFLTSRQFISALLTCSDDRKLSLWYVIRYRITVRSDKDAGEGDLGLCFP